MFLNFIKIAFLSFGFISCSTVGKNQNNLDSKTPTKKIVLTDEKKEVSMNEKLAQDQLVAYNSRNIDAFIKQYSDDVKIYNFPNLHCELLARIIQIDTVIDHEMVTFIVDKPKLFTIAIYKIKDDKISEVYFIK
jgi:hypothetical protein